MVQRERKSEEQQIFIIHSIVGGNFSQRNIYLKGNKIITKTRQLFVIQRLDEESIYVFRLSFENLFFEVSNFKIFQPYADHLDFHFVVSNAETILLILEKNLKDFRREYSFYFVQKIQEQDSYRVVLEMQREVREHKMSHFSITA